MAEATRRKVYDMLVAEKMMVQGFHYPFPALGLYREERIGLSGNSGAVESDDLISFDEKAAQGGFHRQEGCGIAAARPDAH